jgi:hypothetical protein
MRTWGIVTAATMVVAVAAGCGESAPVVPLATDGPNQVVLRVPGMT